MASGDVADLVESLRDALEVDGSLTRVRAFVEARCTAIVRGVAPSEPQRQRGKGEADRYLIQALISEYLQDAGLHSTLAVFDVETNAFPGGAPRPLDSLSGNESAAVLTAAASSHLSGEAVSAVLETEAQVLRDALERFAPGRLMGPRTPSGGGGGGGGGGGHLPTSVVSSELGLEHGPPGKSGAPLLSLLVTAAKERRYADALGRWKGEEEKGGPSAGAALLTDEDEEAPGSVPGVTGGRRLPPLRKDALVGPPRASAVVRPSGGEGKGLQGPAPFEYTT
jgi:hypothetical protein